MVVSSCREFPPPMIQSDSVPAPWQPIPRLSRCGNLARNPQDCRPPERRADRTAHSSSPRSGNHVCKIHLCEKTLLGPPTKPPNTVLHLGSPACRPSYSAFLISPSDPSPPPPP